ncbi:MAG: regulatory protein RecX [Chitinophagales bacterium]|nr:RecX family transcriptional regulator [Chitinophagales bacterium]MDW8274253.1 regulatory protein RecX [Chitinophagales bacterium]
MNNFSMNEEGFSKEEKAVWNAITRFCAYKERCVDDVYRKLIQLGVSENQHHFWVKRLESYGFLNEKRFVESYALARINLKGWGLLKIKNKLLAKNIEPLIVDEVLKKIKDTLNMEEKLLSIAQKKWYKIKTESIQAKKAKLARYLHSKGFGFQDIYKILENDIFR